MEHRAGTPTDANVPGLENFERHDRGVRQVPQFMGEEAEALAPACGFSIDARLISLTPVLGDRAGDGIVEASIQRPKVVGADRGVQLHCQFGDGLTDIAIRVHDLRHREPLKQEVMSMLDRAPADLGAGGLAEAECLSQLVKKHGYAVIDRYFGWRWNRAHGRLGPASSDDLGAMHSNEFMEHLTPRKARS